MKTKSAVRSMLLLYALGTFALTGCSSSAAGQSAGGFDEKHVVNVNTREDGSGTRSAFIELFGIEQKDANGEKTDLTTVEAAVTDSTAVMMSTVSQDLYSIGYISLGSLNETVKAVNIDGVEASVETVKDKSYKIFRPFNLIEKGDLSDAASDFKAFVLSTEGQAVVEENGYIPLDGTSAFESSKPSGDLVISGSSSVTPVMEKLTEAYKAVNPNVEIVVQQSDSSTGISDAADGTSDFGMASRDLKDSETEKGLSQTVVAIDGIAVIVNNDNPVQSLDSSRVREIYTGEITTWTQADN